jgi:Transposase IS116/IS110/IS902 family
LRVFIRSELAAVCVTYCYSFCFAAPAGEVRIVGPVTALAFVLTIGPVSRFANSNKLVSYLGLNPSEESTGGRQRLGAISKQGTP